jgi:SAM-dependent methyltransferase
LQYGKGAPYWDRHYRHNPEPFDWYLRYSSLKDIFSLYLKRSDNILIIGCGNSRLSEDIYDEGFTKITNIDTSPLVIGMMREKYRDRDTMKWILMDGRDMDAPRKEHMTFRCGDEHLPNETIDTIIIKGTLDMFSCTEAGASHIDKVTISIPHTATVYLCIVMQMLKECTRILKPEGNLIIVSYASPDDRIEMLVSYARLHQL